MAVLCLFCPLSPTIDEAFSKDTTVGEGAGVAGVAVLRRDEWNWEGSVVADLRVVPGYQLDRMGGSFFREAVNEDGNCEGGMKTLPPGGNVS